MTNQHGVGGSTIGIEAFQGHALFTVMVMDVCSHDKVFIRIMSAQTTTLAPKVILPLGGRTDEIAKIGWMTDR